LTATTFLTASIEMEANQETHNQGAALYLMAPYGQAVFFCFDGVDGFDDNLEANQRNARRTAKVVPSCRDGGDLSTWVLRETQGVGSFSKVGRKKGAAKQWTVASRECRWRSC